jgi:hypothetical protein
MTDKNNNDKSDDSDDLDLPDGIFADPPTVPERITFHGSVPDADRILPVTSLGEGLVLVKEWKAEFTHAQASRVLEELKPLEMNGISIDRPLRDNHVEYLLNCAKRGTFHPELVTIISCICDEPFGDYPAGTEFRQNGQHTAWMRLYLDESWPCKVNFKQYRAKTGVDMRMLYASIDRGAPRTQGNVISSILAGTDQFIGCNHKLMRLLASGLSFWLEPGKAGEYGPRYDADDLAYQMKTGYKEVINHVINWIMKANEVTHGRERVRKNILRAAVVAALYETFSKLPSRAHEFWNLVRDGIGATSINDPRHKLYEFLREATVVSNKGGMGVGRNAGKRAVTPEEMYRATILSWNAWRDGNELKTIRPVLSSKRPKAK